VLNVTLQGRSGLAKCRCLVAVLTSVELDFLEQSEMPGRAKRVQSSLSRMPLALRTSLPPAPAPCLPAVELLVIGVSRPQGRQLQWR
jgi:hypothetical protein